jgi:hypothetical protein
MYGVTVDYDKIDSAIKHRKTRYSQEIIPEKMTHSNGMVAIQPKIAVAKCVNTFRYVTDKTIYCFRISFQNNNIITRKNTNFGMNEVITKTINLRIIRLPIGRERRTKRLWTYEFINTTKINVELLLKNFMRDGKKNFSLDELNYLIMFVVRYWLANIYTEDWTRTPYRKLFGL